MCTYLFIVYFFQLDVANPTTPEPASLPPRDIILIILFFFKRPNLTKEGRCSAASLQCVSCAVADGNRKGGVYMS